MHNFAFSKEINILMRCEPKTREAETGGSPCLDGQAKRETTSQKARWTVPKEWHPRWPLTSTCTPTHMHPARLYLTSCSRKCRNFKMISDACSSWHIKIWNPRWTGFSGTHLVCEAKACTMPSAHAWHVLHWGCMESRDVTHVSSSRNVWILNFQPLYFQTPFIIANSCPLWTVT